MVVIHSMARHQSECLQVLPRPGDPIICYISHSTYRTVEVSLTHFAEREAAVLKHTSGSAVLCISAAFYVVRAYSYVGGTGHAIEESRDDSPKSLCCVAFSCVIYETQLPTSPSKHVHVSC